ncbi:MAG: phenylalanine--tRNA ligase subunit alpha [Thermoplasmatales archaeon]
MELTNSEKKLIKFLKGKGYVEVDSLFPEFSRNELASSISWLKEKKLVTVVEKPKSYYFLGQEGRSLIDQGLPEEKLLSLYKSGITGLRELEGKMGGDLRYAIAEFLKSGAKVKDGFIVSVKLDELEDRIKKVKDALQHVSSGNYTEDDILLLKQRKGFVGEKIKMERTIKLTALAEQLSPEDLMETEEVSQITPEIIGRYSSGIQFRPYDPTLYAPRYLPSKVHPLSEFIAEVRRVMLDMGFKELRGHIVETAFWNMDILFIPQDHPARDMQDTFYLDGIGEVDPALSRRVKKVHERGIRGSRGWQYPWSKEEASKLLLRTHTTVNTIRYIVEHPNEECRIFSVEKIFRREATDSKHLSEFSQVEGVISGKGVTFGVLIDTLKDFYGRIGVKEIRVKPSYFPYTEPSLEVYGRFKGKEMELGGAGMFRPEVIKPWGVKYNVAAWGLGLERLLMVVLGLDDIREIYRNDLSFLKERRILGFS